MAKKSKIKFPYGRSNFKLLIEKGYHYVDKTHYIEWLENSDEAYIIFLRPRRFGKSLFVSILQHYYGIEFKTDFETLFGQYYIGQHATSEKNSYWILRFNFSGIDTSTPALTHSGFLRKVRNGVEDFIFKYLKITAATRTAILKEPQPNLMLNALMQAIKKQQKAGVYLLIDEYDHFANELLAYDFVAFQEAVSENGYVRKFYETIKNGTDEAVIHQLFITGVSPITLDSLTSGFNIGTHFSLEADLNEMMGFSEEEVIGLLQQVAPTEKQAIILADMRKWYNGYLFNRRGKQRMYNADMVLYFLKEYNRHSAYPDDMLDSNISSDYSKLRRLFAIKTPLKNYEILKELVEGKKQFTHIVKEFSFRRAFTRNDFLSLLFYLGFLTIKEEKGSLLNLGIPNYVIQKLYFDFFIPNYVIQKLYFDFFIARLVQRQEIPSQINQLQQSMLEMAFEGNPQAFFQSIEQVLGHLSRRDYQQFEEKHIKTIIVALATQVNTYFTKSEREYKGGYTDVVFLQRPPFEVDYQYVFELKYLKKTNSKQLKAVQQKAKKQVLDYVAGEEELRTLKNLQTWTVVVIKDELFSERVI